MHIQILGTRGIPSLHGGFETFAHDLSLYLTERGHKVTVYCHVDASEAQREDMWCGVRRILIPAATTAWGTVLFDWKSVLHASQEDGLALTLGYNTAVFSALYRLTGHRSVMNMDGLEWKRQKWSRPARTWLRLNEWMGAKLSNHLIADHPKIAEHLNRHTHLDKISMIPYGSHESVDRDDSALAQFNLESGRYYLLIARPEPENSILEIIKAYSASPRRVPLVVVGAYTQAHPYHASVLSLASENVRFIGPVYERPVVAALRHHATAYLHGHQVGGTNPSLVESLAAGNAIIAHDNVFTRWVIGKTAKFFSDTASLDRIFTDIDNPESSAESLQSLGQASRYRYLAMFRQQAVLMQYESLLLRFAKVSHTSEEAFAIERARSVSLISAD